MPDRAVDTDIFSPEKRSEIMSLVRHESTKPEILVRKLLHRAGYRFRLHNRKLSSTPGIVLPKYKAVVFVYGCFWHHHEGCKKGPSMVVKLLTPLKMGLPVTILSL